MYTSASGLRGKKSVWDSRWGVFWQPGSIDSLCGISALSGGKEETENMEHSSNIIADYDALVLVPELFH